MNPVTATSREIVRSSGSNLAFALAVLPAEKREDMAVFYAFCRVADDLADMPGLSAEERLAGLRRWRGLVTAEASDPKTGIESEVVALIENRDLRRDDFVAILDGIEMDLEPLRFSSREELKGYCYRVASAVGLVSIELFGYENPDCRYYAEELGYALQWTNILRDVGEDAEEGRVFLPLDDLARFDLTEESIL
ncbi:MAG: squalene/phytoene synthase family protein, partial [Verrucomicrobiota bacterium]